MMIPPFEIFGKSISAYMICALVGYLVMLWALYKLALRNKLNELHMLFMLLFSAIGVLIGGHLLYGITNMQLFVRLLQNLGRLTSVQELLDCIVAIFGGAVFYGGLLGALAVAYIYIRKNKLEFWPYVSLAIIGIPLFHFFGRLGCFLSGCCYGVEWSHGITYHYSLVEAANGVPRFPVQLVEAGFNLALFFVLLYVYTKTRYKYKTLYIYFFAYPVCRFLLEFLRGDEYRGFLLGISTSQIISLLLFGVTAAAYWRSRHRAAQGSPQAQ